MMMTDMLIRFAFRKNQKCIEETDHCGSGDCVHHHRDERGPLNREATDNRGMENCSKQADERSCESVEIPDKRICRVRSKEYEHETEDESDFQEIDEKAEKQKWSGGVAIHESKGNGTIGDGQKRNFLRKSLPYASIVPNSPLPALMNISASSGDAMSEFSKAYDEYKDAIFRHCYFHTFDRERAKDLLQETFVKTWEYIAAGNDVDNVRAFLYKVATNLVINAARKKKEQSLEALQEQGFDPAGDDNPAARDHIAEDRVIRLLGTIDEPYRSAVTLRFIEGLSPAEIADVTGESANSISVRINRGLKQLRVRFDHHG